MLKNEGSCFSGGKQSGKLAADQDQDEWPSKEPDDMLKSIGCFVEIPTLGQTFLVTSRAESFLPLITLVKTTPEAQYCTWHLVLSSCLVLLDKQV